MNYIHYLLQDLVDRSVGAQLNGDLDSATAQKRSEEYLAHAEVELIVWVNNLLNAQVPDAKFPSTMEHEKLRDAQRAVLKGEQPNPIEAITRLEVIDEEGRVYVAGPMYKTGSVKIEESWQDEGRTLKIFVSKRAKETANEG